MKKVTIKDIFMCRQNNRETLFLTRERVNKNKKKKPSYLLANFTGNGLGFPIGYAN